MKHIHVKKDGRLIFGAQIHPDIARDVLKFAEGLGGVVSHNVEQQDKPKKKKRREAEDSFGSNDRESGASPEDSGFL